MGVSHRFSSIMLMITCTNTMVHRTEIHILSCLLTSSIWSMRRAYTLQHLYGQIPDSVRYTSRTVQC